MEVRDLSVHFELRGRDPVAGCSGVTPARSRRSTASTSTLRPGEVVGLVGESGSGKSTLGRALLGLVPATEGSIHLRDQDLADLSRRQLREIRQVVQMVFQDPNAALNPSMTVEEAVGDALRVHGMRSATERRTRVVEALERVGLSPVELFLTKYPRDLSGGQKQRVVMARAIVLDPELLVADEPVSMLDMSVRAKILQLMLDLKQELGLTYVYITHDLATAKYFCDRIAIMYLGRVVEIGPTEEIFANPRHPYTKALLAAIPEPDPDKHGAARPAAGRDPGRRAATARAARSTRGARRRSPACGWESRDLRALVEEHWMRADAAYDEEQNGDRRPRAPGRPVDHRRRSGPVAARRCAPILDRMKAEDTSEPLWSGVTAIEDAGTGRHRALRAGPVARSAAGRRRRGGLRALPRGRRRRRGLNPHRCRVVVPATNGDPDPRGRILVSSHHGPEDLDMIDPHRPGRPRPRGADPAGGLVAPAIGLARRRGRRRPHERPLLGQRRTGSSRPSPTTAGSRSRARSTATCPGRCGHWKFKHNGSVSAQRAPTRRAGASGSF